ncbi:uncharacterized protein [Epargyreus clarus]|uniref:uncharacterized protein n=1 Tax=Epargyreus clarus TaxID=520877 RepID=UPI003C2F41E2
MTDEKPDFMIMTQEQFNTLLNKLSESCEFARNNKSFAHCFTKYDGERNHNKVEEFIASVSIYKKLENITDEDALEGLTLLLIGEAATWWSGIKPEVKKWNQALEAIRSAFAPKMQAYEIYMELFSKKQTKESIDEFLSEKRALMSKLPAKRHKEEEQLDLVYGLLNVSYKKEIPRTEIKTFSELLERGRHLESIIKEAGDRKEEPNIKVRRCTFCGKKGHTVDVCRKRLSAASKVVLKDTPKISCYGCGAPGVIRSNCDVCKNKETPPKPVSFYTIKTTMQANVKIPTIEISVKGEKGYAYIDTAARTSIASAQLYKTLIRKGTKFTALPTEIKLADGTTKSSNLLTATVDVIIGGRILPVTFSAIPEAKDNRTLLGIDCLEKAGIVLNLGQRGWYFIDEPETTHNFLNLSNEVIPLKAAKAISFVENKEEVSDENLSSFLTYVRDLKRLSPMSETPSPLKSTDSPPESKRPKWTLHKLSSPPKPVRPREPADQNSCIDPRIIYLPKLKRLANDLKLAKEIIECNKEVTQGDHGRTLVLVLRRDDFRVPEGEDVTERRTIRLTNAHAHIDNCDKKMVGRVYAPNAHSGDIK